MPWGDGGRVLRYSGPRSAGLGRGKKTWGGKRNNFVPLRRKPSLLVFIGRGWTKKKLRDRSRERVEQKDGGYRFFG